MPTQLIISPTQIATIGHFAEKSYPEECCGLLIGTSIIQIDSTPIITVTSLYPTRNAWPEQHQLIESEEPSNPNHSARDRFIIDPTEQLAAMKQIRAIGQAIVGVYHSHPDHSAIPSETDRRMAWPEYVYWITSVAQGQAIAHRCWQLQTDGGFAENHMVISRNSAHE
jgi:proteasome lid subunit RPN8/RPN11